MAGRPRNWHDMNHDEQIAWRRQEAERDELEWAAEESRRAADRASDEAAQARRRLNASLEERDGYASALEAAINERDEAIAKHEQLRAEHNQLLAECKAIQPLCDAVRAHTEDIPGTCWLRILASAYDQEHDWEGDEDPTATQEMLLACRQLADAVEAFGRRHSNSPPQPPASQQPSDSDMPF